MHPCAAALAEAERLMAVEKAALAEEDVDMADELSQTRSRLLHEAWVLREGFAADTMLAILERILAGQEELTAMGRQLQEKLRSQLNVGRKQARYFDGDRHEHAQSRKSLYCDAVF
ncbi:hypothetical protein LJC59_09055 [Desulfovibrio sp. OttesenSCG-928-A18]|nr:hypothetical protein [Desulfovibrio sp. OttesenSCG-928-A18]